MKSTEEIREKLEDALTVLGGFWKTDEESQQFALELSLCCIKAILKMLEDAK